MKAKINFPTKICLFLFITISVIACKKNYIIGGKVEDVNKYANMTSYDVLNSLPQFDTLVQVIDAAGLKDKINQDNSTFFAISNGSIFNYLQLRTLLLQATVNQYAKFTLDSLKYYLQNNINGTKDSLLMYQVATTLTTSNLTNNGAQYPSGLIGDSVLVSYETTLDPLLGYTSLVSTPPRVVYFAQLWKHYNLNSKDSTAAKLPSTTGVRSLVSTSFIKTKNGMINVLTPRNTLFFYGTKIN